MVHSLSVLTQERPNIKGTRTFRQEMSASQDALSKRSLASPPESLLQCKINPGQLSNNRSGVFHNAYIINRPL